VVAAVTDESESAGLMERVCRFKFAAMRHYDDVVEGAATMEDLLDSFVTRMRSALAADAPMHRLWYELRNASRVEERLRATVALVDSWLEDAVARVVLRYACLAEREPALTPATAYAILDGLVQQALSSMREGQAEALDRFERSVRELFPSLLAAA
jgi:hypothetical protein